MVSTISLEMKDSLDFCGWEKLNFPLCARVGTSHLWGFPKRLFSPKNNKKKSGMILHS